MREAGNVVTVMLERRIEDSDLSAFLTYAARERSLDASLRLATHQGRGAEHRKSIDTLRELNARMLIRETTHRR